MNNQSLIQFFRGSNFVSEQTAKEIADVFALKEIPKNKFFLKEGRVCDQYFFLANGFMRAFAHDTEGIEITTDFYSSNMVVIEV